jgi:hypothetical protein
MDKGPNKKKRRREKEKKYIYAAKFSFIFKVQKRKVIFKYGAV